MAARPIALSLAFPPMSFSPADPVEDHYPDVPPEALVEPEPEDFTHFYLTVLLAIACLLAMVQRRR